MPKMCFKVSKYNNNKSIISIFAPPKVYNLDGVFNEGLFFFAKPDDSRATYFCCPEYYNHNNSFHIISHNTYLVDGDYDSYGNIKYSFYREIIKNYSRPSKDWKMYIKLAYYVATNRGVQSSLLLPRSWVSWFLRCTELGLKSLDCSSYDNSLCDNSNKELVWL